MEIEGEVVVYQSSARDGFASLALKNEGDLAPVEERLDVTPAPRGLGEGIVLDVSGAVTVGLGDGGGGFWVREGDVLDVALHEGALLWGAHALVPVLNGLGLL